MPREIKALYACACFYILFCFFFYLFVCVSVRQHEGQRAEMSVFGTPLGVISFEEMNKTEYHFVCVVVSMELLATVKKFEERHE